MWHKTLTAIVLVLTVLASSAHAHQLGFDNTEDKAQFLEQRQNETVWLVIKKYEGTTTQCTGAYLGDRWILTAAHCVVDEQSGNIDSDIRQIYAVDHDHWKDDQGYTPVQIVKAKYGQWKGAYVDLALLRTDRPIQAKSVDVSCKLPSLGENIVIVGHPSLFQWSVSIGMISTLERDVGMDKEDSYAQLRFIAPGITNGASGAPIFNQNGKMIGIYTTTQAEKQPNPVDGQPDVIDVGMSYGASGPRICDFFK